MNFLHNKVYQIRILLSLKTQRMSRLTLCISICQTSATNDGQRIKRTLINTISYYLFLPLLCHMSMSRISWMNHFQRNLKAKANKKSYQWSKVRNMYLKAKLKNCSKMIFRRWEKITKWSIFVRICYIPI